jgi:hypothetical protein
MTAANDLAVRRALESAGVEFIGGNSGGRTPPETPAGEAPQVIDARPRNQPPLPECRMPGLAAGQNLPQEGRPRQAEVMDLRAAGVELLDENGGGPGAATKAATRP